MAQDLKAQLTLHEPGSSRNLSPTAQRGVSLFPPFGGGEGMFRDSHRSLGLHDLQFATGGGFSDPSLVLSGPQQAGSNKSLSRYLQQTSLEGTGMSPTSGAGARGPIYSSAGTPSNSHPL